MKTLARLPTLKTPGRVRPSSRPRPLPLIGPFNPRRRRGARIKRWQSPGNASQAGQGGTLCRCPGTCSCPRPRETSRPSEVSGGASRPPESLPRVSVQAVQGSGFSAVVRGGGAGPQGPPTAPARWFAWLSAPKARLGLLPDVPGLLKNWS